MKKYILCLFICLTFSNTSLAEDFSYCSKVGSWAEAITSTKLINNKEIKQDEIDYDKTSVKLISQTQKDVDLYQQVHLITFYDKNGNKLETISINDVSSEECSMTDVEVYLIKAKY